MRLGKQNALRSHITSMKGAKIVHDYFSYPKMNAKHLDFLEWIKCYSLILKLTISLKVLM